MITLETTQTIPLTLWKDGTIRVKGTRLLVDMIIDAHKRGEIPEEIFDSFPSNDYTVADIYLVISYYLSNKSMLEKYMAKREKEAENFWKKVESEPKYQARINEFKKLRKQS